MSSNRLRSSGIWAGRPAELRETAIRLFLAAAVASLPVADAEAQALPSDHVIVPGERIGNAELDPADQGSLQRNLGEPNATEQHGDMATYRYGAPKPDSGSPDEL